MTELMKRSSTYLFVSGALAVVFGIVATLFPVGTAITLVIMWGVYALVDGVAAVVMAFRPDGAKARLFLLVTGVIGIFAGLFAIFRPITSAVALAWVLGIWLIVRGVMEIAGAFGTRAAGPRWLTVLGGIFWIIAGVLMVSFPDVAALSISLWIGILAIVWGIVLLIVGWQVRRLGQDDTRVPGEVVPPAGNATTGPAGS